MAIERPRLCILLNPVSGPTRTRGVEWEWLAADAEQAGWRAELIRSEGPGDIERLAREAVAGGVRRLVVVGGDGSINEAVQAVVGTEVELGLVPAGTSNILANELGIPDDFRQAARLAFTGRALAIDVGRANDRYFTLMLGIGYDVSTIEVMWPQLKRLMGQVAYTVAGFQAFVQHRAVRMRVEIDGTRMRRLVYFLVVANTRLYGMASTKVAEHADVRDGLFDVVIIRARAWYHVIISMLRIFFRIKSPFEKVETIRGREVTIRSSRKVRYQLDGDAAGTLPVKVSMLPQALRIIAP
ncbi:MAG TPA: diacylglycerol kinase family protein [Stenomitos sp.]